MQRTFLMVKPDGVQRGLIGEIVTRFERKGLQLVAAKFMWINEEQATQHYREHQDKPFFEELVAMVTSGPVLAMVWQGNEAIAVARALIGKTALLEASAGTIRGDFAARTRMNVVHGADSPESAQREINLFFEPHECVEYTRTIAPWV